MIDGLVFQVRLHELSTPVLVRDEGATHPLQPSPSLGVDALMPFASLFALLSPTDAIGQRERPSPRTLSMSRPLTQSRKRLEHLATWSACSRFDVSSMAALNSNIASTPATSTLGLHRTTAGTLRRSLCHHHRRINLRHGFSLLCTLSRGLRHPANVNRV